MTSSITDSDIGDYEITVTGTDGHSDTTTDTNVFNITIVANQPPSVNETIPQLTFTIGRTSTYTVSADAFTDPEGVALTYSGAASSSAPYLSIDPSTGVITSNNPTSGNVPSFTYYISASDGIAGNAAATQSVSIYELIIFR